MPRARKHSVREEHSSDVDQLADDDVLAEDAPAFRPTGPPRVAPRITVTGASRPLAGKVTKPSVTRKVSAAKADRVLACAESPVASNSLERFRYNKGPTTRLDENLSSDNIRNGKSPIKRPRPNKEVTPQPSKRASSTRTTVSERDPKPAKKKSAVDDEVFFLPELDEDGEPIYDDSSAPPVVALTAGGASSFRSPLRTASRFPSKLDSFVSSPFRAAGSRTAHSTPRASRPASSVALPSSAPSTPLRRPPSSIDLPDALAARVYARVSPTSSNAPALGFAPVPTARSSPAHVQHAQVACGAQAMSSQRLTSEQQKEVTALVADLQMDFDEELEEAFAGVDDDEVGLAPHLSPTASASRAQHKQAAEDPDTTFVDIAAESSPEDLKGAAAPAPSPSPANSSPAAADPFADDIPIAAPLTEPDTSCFRSISPSPPQPALRAFPSPRAARPAATATAHNPYYRATTPPPRPPGYRLVPLTAAGLAEHAREVVAASAAGSAAGAGETAYLRGEVARLVGELERRDALLGQRGEELRNARDREEVWSGKEQEWEKERKAFEGKVDVLKEVRRGLLAELKEERARADELERKLAVLKSAAAPERAMAAEASTASPALPHGAEQVVPENVAALVADNDQLEGSDGTGEALQDLSTLASHEVAQETPGAVGAAEQA